MFTADGEWIIVVLKKPSEKVGEGEEIAKLLDMETLEERPVESPIRGIVYWIGSTRPI